MFEDGPNDFYIANRLGIKISLTKWSFPWYRKIGNIRNTETDKVLGLDLGSSNEISEQEEEKESGEAYELQQWDLLHPDVFGYFQIILREKNLQLFAEKNDNKQEPILTVVAGMS